MNINKESDIEFKDMLHTIPLPVAIPHRMHWFPSDHHKVKAVLGQPSTWMGDHTFFPESLDSSQVCCHDSVYTHYRIITVLNLYVIS